MRMSFSVLFLNLIMGIAMFVVEVVMLLLVAGILGISIVPVAVRVAVTITGVAVVRITVAIARSNRDREAAMGGRCGWHQGGKSRGTAQE